MNARQWINNNSALATIVAVVLLGLALLIAVRSMMGPSRPAMATKAWYYDLDTGEAFAGAVDLVPPFDHQGGKNNGVSLIMYACGDCGGDVKMAYIQKYRDEDRVKVEAFRRQMAEGGPAPGPAGLMPGMMPGGLNADMLVSSPERGAIRWIPMMSTEGIALLNSGRESCPDPAQYRPCLPK